MRSAEYAERPKIHKCNKSRTEILVIFKLCDIIFKQGISRHGLARSRMTLIFEAPIGQRRHTRRSHWSHKGQTQTCFV